MPTKKLKIVTVNYLEYNLNIKKSEYFYKTKDFVKMGDYVYCESPFGIVVGRVQLVYETIEELLKNIEIAPKLHDLKMCRKVLNDVYNGLPF